MLLAERKSQCATGLRSIVRNQAGATMVEFAIALIIIILLFGAVFDIGLGLHRYAMLKQVTTESTRQIAVRLQTHRDCSYIRTYLETIANDKLVNHLARGSSPRWETQWDNHGSGILFPVFRVRSAIAAQCYFLCALFPNGIPITASSERVIERKGIGVGGQGCPQVLI